MWFLTLFKIITLLIILMWSAVAIVFWGYVIISVQISLMYLFIVTVVIIVFELIKIYSFQDGNICRLSLRWT
jgi:hypothetical protein